MSSNICEADPRNYLQTKANKRSNSKRIRVASLSDLKLIPS